MAAGSAKPALTANAISTGLAALGVEPGMLLCVHASLSALGQVEGGPRGLIDGLMDALGPQGTLMMPTHPARDGQVFDARATPSAMGATSEAFRNMPGVLRSAHPYHPVAAMGALAERLLKDHEKSAIPDGPHTPYGRLVEYGGHVLLAGCDLDTLTLLHTVEAELDLPYLRELEMPYIDAAGATRSLALQRCPGGHRGGVLKFDHLFREEGAMQVGRIGNAVCRLLDARKAAAILRRELGRDPAFALDDNPHCEECLRFRGQVQASRLKAEDFRLTMRIPHNRRVNPARFLALAQAEGVGTVEIERPQEWRFQDRQELVEAVRAHGMHIAVLRVGLPSLPGWAAVLEDAAALDVQHLHINAPAAGSPRPEWIETLATISAQLQDQSLSILIGNRRGSLLETPEDLCGLLDAAGDSFLASYNPLEAARAGIKPFYDGLYTGRLRRKLGHVDLCDGIRGGGKLLPLGQGHAEIREIISNLRARTYGGFLCLWPVPEHEDTGARQAGRQFWEIMNSI